MLNWFQYEGTRNGDGKGPSIWDSFTHKHPDRIIDDSNDDVAIDFYHRYKLSKGVNIEGIAFYNNLINELLANGIQPLVSIFHWDLPQALEQDYQGFLSPQIVDDFGDYAELCFKEFGDRIKDWITINEPYSYALFGYVTGSYAPGRCSAFTNNNMCGVGNAATDPYIVGHHMLLAHAKAVNLYRDKYKASLKGKIGISLISNWFVPNSTKKEDIDSVERALDFMFMHPVTYGDYLVSMRERVKNRLPKFTSEEAEMVKNSYDFLGLNYYTSTSLYAANISYPDTVNITYIEDYQVYQTCIKNGIPIGERTGSKGVFVVPEGLLELLVYTKEKYKNPIIYITENGMSDANVTIVEGVNDLQRTDFIRQHLLAIKDAIQDGVNVKGYFIWSFLDNFEWSSGNTQRYGINYVDYNDNLKRYPKRSACWLKKFLSRYDC
ncbi:hypothetical protein H5410_064537 [Solanum commersonii]|uniref:Beta-glucosidase n=1 Tax=Solanum commersonii TaxID=4109 RepID=A0A9J5VZ15_SOLCO|nr:hypothetical protein H5410_064537 [Solanum commersonii]